MGVIPLGETRMQQEKNHWRSSKGMQARAREMRRAMTPAERKLWSQLRLKQGDGAHFRRQHAVGPYIVDFFCAKAKLVIEVDGDSHGNPEQEEYDAERTVWLDEQKDYLVIRFWNDDVLNALDGTMQVIWQAVHDTKENL